MGTAERKERELQLRRQRILEVGKNLFLERGYDHVSVREICDAIEFGKSAFYNLFSSKEELHASIKARGFRELAEKLKEASKGQSDRLQGLASGFCDFLENQPAHFKALFVADISQENVALPVQEELESSIQECRSAVRQGLAQSGTSDDEQLAFLFYAGLIGVISYFPRHGTYSMDSVRSAAAAFVRLFQPSHSAV